MTKEKTELEKRVIANANEEEKALVADLQEEAMSNSKVSRFVGSNKHLTPAQRNQLTKVNHFESIDALLEFSKMLVTSKIVPFSSAEQVATIMLQGKELGLSPVTSLFNIYYFNNKPALSVHAHNALLKKAGIASQTLEDGVYLDKDNKIINTNVGKADARSTIEFARKNELLGIVKEKGVFSFSEAVKAELHLKDNWKNYPKQMLWNRAFTIGARRIGADVLLGCMEITEMADVTNTPYILTPDNEVIIP